MHGYPALEGFGITLTKNQRVASKPAKKRTGFKVDFLSSQFCAFFKLSAKEK